MAVSFKSKIIYIIFTAIVILVVGVYQYFHIPGGEEYSREYSPDHQFSVYIVPYKYDFMIDIVKFSFQKYGDRSGKIFLYDEMEKKIIASGHVDMIGFVDVVWTENEIYTKGDGGLDKTLPRKINLNN